MTYYSVIVMKDGQIHLKPFDSKEKAEEAGAKIYASDRWGSQVDFTKVIKRKEIIHIRKNHNRVVSIAYDDAD